MIEAIVYQKFICMVSIFSLVCNWITASPSDALAPEPLIMWTVQGR